ncbi:MAG: TSUP family transporter, partial [Rhodoferax sp.]|nr:TSUP family transporter [Rhodoferax sp.]
MDLLLASLASFVAGMIDSIVGGGGLILVPALFAIYPSAPPAALFGTNKSASVWGTAFATLQYAR